MLRAKCAVDNVLSHAPNYCCFFGLFVSSSLKPADNISSLALILRRINTHIGIMLGRPDTHSWTSFFFMLNSITVHEIFSILSNHQLHYVAMATVTTVFSWTLTPELIVWWCKYDGAIMINIETHLHSYYCFTTAQYDIIL